MSTRWPAGLALLFALVAGLPGPGARAADLLREGTPHEALFAVAFDGSDGYAAGNLGSLFETDDGGATWTAIDGPPTDLAVLGIAADAGRVVTVGQLGEIFVRDGDDWAAAANDNEERLFSVALLGDGAAVAVGAFGTILRSTDNGESWTRIPVDWSAVLSDGFEPHLYDVAVASDGAVVAVGEFALVMRSADGGANWQSVHTGEESLFGVALDGAHGLAVGQDGLVLSTSDDGKSWGGGPSGLAGNLIDVSLDGETAVAVGVRVAGISRDAGATWNELEDRQLESGWFPAAAVRPGGGTVVAGYAGRIVAID